MDSVLLRVWFSHSVEDSSFRCYVVPSSQHARVLEALHSPAFATGTRHWTVVNNDDPDNLTPCIHIPSSGGLDAPIDDGEPQRANIGGTLLKEVPAGGAVIVWRRFGGTLLGVSSGRLQDAYRHVAREGVRIYQLAHLAEWTEQSVAEQRRWERLEPMLLPLPVPCVYYDQFFLSEDLADRMLENFLTSIPWERGDGTREQRSTALYGDEEYGSRDQKGYASAHVNSWESAPSLLIELKNIAEMWINRDTPNEADKVSFNVCLLNRYSSSSEHLAWHAVSV